MANHDVTIRAHLAGKEVSRAAILEWEARRIPQAAKKIGLPTPSGTLAQRKDRFADAKLALTPDDIRSRLARDLRMAGTTARVTSRLSFGRPAISTCDLQVTGGDAKTFVDWFSDTDRDDYARSMVVAHPDHFLIDTAPDGSQEVIETTGGSPLATQFFIDYSDTSPLRTPRNQTYPYEAAGVARTDRGLAIGGVRHEFQDTADGFHARLLIEFPLLTAPHMISQHRWHLACEFSNWVEAAFASA